MQRQYIVAGFRTQVWITIRACAALQVVSAALAQDLRAVRFVSPSLLSCRDDMLVVVAGTGSGSRRL